DANVVAGKALFLRTDCAKCHTPALTTGAYSIEALAYKTFYPYTDLLMHDMGAGLDDGYTEGNAKTAEWRTPALWGLGLSKNAQGGQYFLLHDGRAHSISEAITLHGGEAANSVNKYRALSAAEQQQLITFLESL
ncbi:MAG: thiol oxidoreductase, partial [Chitinophagia bacterium]|nr:thiol oxidoreductase [Chitinophagia bacterium]